MVTTGESAIRRTRQISATIPAVTPLAIDTNSNTPRKSKTIPSEDGFPRSMAANRTPVVIERKAIQGKNLMILSKDFMVLL